MKKIYNSHIALLTLTAFDTGNGWKKDDDGNLVLKDGNPIYVNSAGQEQAVRGDTISTLNAEARQHRLDKEAAEAKLKDFEGIDPTAARKAIADLKDVDLSKMVNSGELDRVRNEITAQFQQQLADKDKQIETTTSKFNSLQISNLFGSSEFVRDNVAMPADFFTEYFGKNFKIEDDKIVAYDAHGNRLMSRKNMGEFASGDEAIEMLVNMHPQKDAILKADGHSGTGGGGGGGGRGGSLPRMKRSEFETLAPAKQAEFAAKVGSGEAQFVD